MLRVDEAFQIASYLTQRPCHGICSLCAHSAIVILPGRTVSVACLKQFGSLVRDHTFIQQNELKLCIFFWVSQFQTIRFKRKNFGTQEIFTGWYTTQDMSCQNQLCFQDVSVHLIGNVCLQGFFSVTPLACIISCKL